MENNNYYEPTIKTARKEKYPKRMFFEEQEYIPKQSIISFLENKIKVHEDIIKSDKDKITIYVLEALNIELKEVLDFVNKGGKNE